VVSEGAHHRAGRAGIALAGIIEVVGVRRITHLAYAPEIAQAMLARPAGERDRRRPGFKIVEGAVGMVQSAPGTGLRELEVVELDEGSAKPRWSPNLLVVLCGGPQTCSPVVNTGTLYG